MKIKQIEFITSVAGKNILTDAHNEFAFVGRSNVGKSSLINSLSNNKKIAKSSSQPGCTQLINYFKVNNGEFHFVDLPGYGYAKVSKEQKKHWGKNIENYLLNSPNLLHVFVIIDIRHKPTEDDLLMINYLNATRIPFTVITNKSDKLSRNQIAKQEQIICNETKLAKDNIIQYSAITHSGKEEVLAKIDNILTNINEVEI